MSESRYCLKCPTGATTKDMCNLCYQPTYLFDDAQRIWNKNKPDPLTMDHAVQIVCAFADLQTAVGHHDKAVLEVAYEKIIGSEAYNKILGEKG